MIVTLGVRVLQLIFAAVVLALSAVLIQGYGPGHAPSLIDYGAFCGATAILIGIIGVVACFVDSLQGVIMLVLDGLATLFLLAGGIAFAATLKAGSCGDEEYLITENVIKTVWPGMEKIQEYRYDDNEDALLDFIKSRCRMAQADTAILWFTFACAAGALVLSFFSHKSGTRGAIV